MTEFIEDPRRGPRLTVRCAVRVALRKGGFFHSCTTDVGPGGCQITAPYRLESGERVYLEVDCESPGPSVLTGHVAWSSSEPPWRGGVAFDQGSIDMAVALFRGLSSEGASADPAAERLPLDAILVPTPIPGSLAVAPVEVEVLRALGSGMDARGLRDRLGERWDACIGGVFALLDRNLIEVRLPNERPRTDRA